MKKFLTTAVAAAALAATPFVTQQLSSDDLDPISAQAQEHGGSGGKGGQGYRGGRGASGGGITKGGHEDITKGGHEDGESEHESGGKGKGRSGGGDHAEGDEHEGSEGGDHGGKNGSDDGLGRGGGGRRVSDTTGQGGLPIWAREGIPEVELGRMNVARSPGTIERAALEAIGTFNAAAAAQLYSMTAEAFSDYVEANWSTAAIIDSPVQNLGLLKDFLTDGATQLPGVTPASKTDLAAIFLGTASDKTIPISQDSVVAITRILGVTVSEADAAAIAAKAEDVRSGILTGHGE